MFVWVGSLFGEDRAPCWKRRCAGVISAHSINQRSIISAYSYSMLRGITYLDAWPARVVRRGPVTSEHRVLPDVLAFIIDAFRRIKYLWMEFLAPTTRLFDISREKLRIMEHQLISGSHRNFSTSWKVTESLYFCSNSNDHNYPLERYSIGEFINETIFDVGGSPLFTPDKTSSLDSRSYLSLIIRLDYRHISSIS